VFLADDAEAKVVTGIDDHSRFVVCARLVDRATARPVCEALRPARARGAGADPDRQREGGHRPVRHRRRFRRPGALLTGTVDADVDSATLGQVLHS
jgi:hypothetical protein